MNRHWNRKSNMPVRVPPLSDTENALEHSGFPLHEDAPSAATVQSPIIQKKRKSLVSNQRIERTLRAAIAAGLTPTQVSHSVDGSVSIFFGDNHQRPYVPKGWDI